MKILLTYWILMLIIIEFPEVILCLDALIISTNHKLNYIVPTINQCRISFKRT